MRVAQKIASLGALFFRTESNFKGGTAASDAGMANAFFSELRTQVACDSIGTLIDSGIHIHFQQEVHTTAQVQT